MSFMGSSSGGGGGFGGGAGADLFSSFGNLIGDLAEAQGYQKAASYEKQNAQLEREAGKVNELRQQRAAFQSFGAENAAYAANGVKSTSGSAWYALQEAHSNAALDHALISMNTAIKVNADLAKASEYSAEAVAKTASGIGGFLGSIVGAFGF